MRDPAPDRCFAALRGLTDFRSTPLNAAERWGRLGRNWGTVCAWGNRATRLLSVALTPVSTCFEIEIDDAEPLRSLADDVSHAITPSTVVDGVEGANALEVLLVTAALLELDEPLRAS